MYILTFATENLQLKIVDWDMAYSLEKVLIYQDLIFLSRSLTFVFNGNNKQ